MNKPFLITLLALVTACGILAFLWQSADKKAVKLSGDLRTEKAERVDLQSRHNQLSGQFNATNAAQERTIATLRDSIDRADQALLKARQEADRADDEYQSKTEQHQEAVQNDDYAQTWDRHCLPLHMRDGRLCAETAK